MRILFAAVTALIAVGAVDRAQAVDYPWCAQYTGEWGQSTNCGFTSQAQCLASVSGVGGYCRQNPYYYAYGYDRRGEPQPRRRARPY